MIAAATAHGVVRRMEGAPVVALRVVLPGGARREATPGLALVTGRMLGEGTRRRDWRTLALAAEERGITVAGYGGLESHGVAVDALASDWERALELAAELLFEPAFPTQRVDWVARHAAAELEAEADQADVLTGRAFAELLYGSHPKGRPLQGDAASLAALESAHCRSFHDAALARGGYVVVAGEVEPDAVDAALARTFGGLQRPGGEPFAPPAPPPPGPRRRELRTRARDQAHLLVGALTVDRADPDFEALELAGVALGAGAGLSGRIPARVRDREGLAYSAWADLVSGAGLDAGRFAAYVGTAPKSLARAEAAVREELFRLLVDGLPARELDEARSYLLGREPFRRETARQWAELTAQGLVQELPLADEPWRRGRIESVGREAVDAALRRHLDPERLAVAVGLPAR